MKIAIVATPISGGGRSRALAYKKFLESKNHQVEIIDINPTWFSKVTYFYQRVKSHLTDKEPGLMKEIARRIEKRIVNGNFEAIIGVESLFSHILTYKEIDCLKVFSWESIGADELRFSPHPADEAHVRAFREKELEICDHSDHVVLPWETTEDYVRKNIYNDSKLMTIRFGCYPQNNSPTYSNPATIVSLGGLASYWSNIDLLAYLTKTSPYVIDAYGRSKPKKQKINYKGYAPSLDILFNYQFGLNTLSKDTFRQHHFSSRILSYLAYGLPVLSPDWMVLSHELEGCIAYNENNFVELVDEYSETGKWTQLSKQASEQGKKLDWNITLQPLERIIIEHGKK